MGWTSTYHEHKIKLIIFIAMSKTHEQQTSKKTNNTRNMMESKISQGLSSGGARQKATKKRKLRTRE